jgi:hypothetical protein
VLPAMCNKGLEAQQIVNMITDTYSDKLDQCLTFRTLSRTITLWRRKCALEILGAGA